MPVYPGAFRKFTFGHVRQFDAVASRVLANLAASVGLDFRLDIARPANTFRAHRLILGAGLRPPEARRLRRHDVDAKTRW